MPRSVAAAIVLLVLLGSTPSLADTRVGVQGLAIVGTHGEPNGSFSGTGEGMLLELDQNWPAVQIHLEGIPNIATAKVATGGQSVTATIGLFQASARFRLDRQGRIWAGAGTETLAQQTPIAGIVGRVYSSHLSGGRIELDARLPVSTNTFVETEFGAIPSMRGDVHLVQVYSDGFRATASGAESASMIDLAAAFGIHAGRFEYLYGIRSINFAAKFTDGREADRNVGTGVTAEIRYSL